MTTAHRVMFTQPRCVELQPFEVGEPGPGEVLLRSERTLISTGTELTALTGDFPPNSAWSAYIQFPCPAGYSSVATVIAAGEGVDPERIGQRVTSWASHATHSLMAADRLWAVPDGVDSEAASFSTLAEIVMGGVRRTRLAFGESVVVVGAGLLGQLAAHVSRLAGGWPVVVLDPAETRLPTAQRMGATHALPLTSDGAIDEVRRLTGGRMADVVIEVTGNPAAIVGAVKLARRRGRVALLGSPRGPVTIDLHNEVHTFSLELIGTHNSGHPPVETPSDPWTVGRHVELFLAWQDAGLMDVRPLITHRYPWRQAPAAYAMLLEDRSRALGVVLDWSDGAA